MAQTINTRSGTALAIIALLSAGLMIGLGYRVEQHEFSELWLYYGPLFGLYVLTLWMEWNEREVLLLFGLGLLLRLVLLGTFPGLSDDIYRFVWDGRLWLQGYNPFDQLPAHYMQAGNEAPGLTPALYDQLNSPGYYTIYPPVAQLTFALSSWIVPGNIYGSALSLRSFLFLCELGSLILIWRLLHHFDLPVKRGLIYALNPLIIIEITGNLHYEGAMIFFLLLSLWLLAHSRWTASAIALALSVASKLLPLMFFPLLIRRLGWRRSYWYFPLTGFAILLLFLPLVSATFIENFSQSLDLYFRKFEFNGSLYYLLRWIGFQIVGYNLIATFGPILAMITFTGILSIAWLEKRPDWRNLPEKMLFAISLYLLLTTTIHPWYVSLPVVLCLFTHFRYPVLWSGLIMLTYINYSYPTYFENLWVVALEYVLVGGYFAWEFWVKKLEPTRRREIV